MGVRITVTPGASDPAQKDAADVLVRRSAASTVSSLFADKARRYPTRVAIENGSRQFTYAQLRDRVLCLAAALSRQGVGHGHRVAILSENRAEFLELFLAAGTLGAIVACQNWRLAPAELIHCLDLVEPTVTLVSPRHAAKLAKLKRPGPPPIVLDERYEALLATTSPQEAEGAVNPEDPLLILYTSGTTGLPKGAVISHRAEIARNLVLRAEYGLAEDDTFVAWSPLYHMGAVEYSLGTLMSGGKVIVVDGFDAPAIAAIVGRERLGWLLLMPGTVAAFCAEVRRSGITPVGMKVCGVMADLVPPAEIAEATALLGAPYANTFGATETGNPPASAGLVPIGAMPERLSKRQSAFCEVRLVDAEDRDVPDGDPGELAIRGPTLFSGYWRAPEANARDFRGGWFHMGDMFVRNPDGLLDFVDRVKYMIKSGGENIYPAEIERVIMQDARVADVAVVRRPDPKWGEVPIAFVARRDVSLTEEILHGLCRAHLAGFKQPKGIRFIEMEAFPRSASGKIQRHELEKMLARS